MEGDSLPRGEASMISRGGTGDVGGRDAAVRERIREARRLCRDWEARLRRDAATARLLARLEAALDRSRRVLRASGVAEICRRCELLEGGSCCGVGIEERYDAFQLLINLLIGIDLPDRRFSPDSCYFLGPEGCRLAARHVLCVNYLCGKIKARLTPAEILEIQTVVGEELDVGFVLYERIKEIVRSGP